MLCFQRCQPNSHGTESDAMLDYLVKNCSGTLKVKFVYVCICCMQRLNFIAVYGVFIFGFYFIYKPL